MTYEEIRTNAEIEALINKGNNNLGNLGYTEHGKAHGTLVAQRAAYVFSSPSMSWAAELSGQRRKMKRKVRRYVAAVFNNCRFIAKLTYFWNFPK